MKRNKMQILFMAGCLILSGIAWFLYSILTLIFITWPIGYAVYVYFVTALLTLGIGIFYYMIFIKILLNKPTMEQRVKALESAVYGETNKN